MRKENNDETFEDLPVNKFVLCDNHLRMTYTVVVPQRIGIDTEVSVSPLWQPQLMHNYIEKSLMSVTVEAVAAILVAVRTVLEAQVRSSEAADHRYLMSQVYYSLI